MRSIRSSPTGGRPAPSPCGCTGSISAVSLPHGITVFICARNSSRRVGLRYFSKLASANVSCFGRITSPLMLNRCCILIRITRINQSFPSLSAAELALEVAHERIDPDALDRLSVAMQGVELAAALGIADVLPVGSLVAGAGKARLLDEGFEQDRSVGGAVLR